MAAFITFTMKNDTIMHKQSVREIHFAASALCTLHFPSMAIVAHFTLHLHQTKRFKWDFAQRHFGVKPKEKNGDKTKYVGSFYFNQTVTFPEHYMTTLFFAITLFTSTECCYHFLRCFGIFRVLMISVCGKLYRSLLIEFFFVFHRKKTFIFLFFSRCWNNIHTTVYKHLATRHFFLLFCFYRVWYGFSKLTVVLIFCMRLYESACGQLTRVR